MPPSLSKSELEKIANINSDLSQLSAPETTIAQLEENSEKLALVFGTYQMETNQKLLNTWCKVSLAVYAQSKA